MARSGARAGLMAESSRVHRLPPGLLTAIGLVRNIRYARSSTPALRGGPGGYRRGEWFRGQEGGWSPSGHIRLLGDFT